MSLRLRLMGLVTIALVTSLIFGGAIACLNASHSVGSEMRSALALGRRIVDGVARAAALSPDPRRDLAGLVALFEGNRHLRVSLAGDPAATAAPATEKGPFGPAPAWFVRLVNVPSVSDRARITLAGRPDETIVLETDPRNETLDVWTDFVNTLIVLLLFTGQTMLLIYLFIGRTLHPLYALAEALEQIRPGRYATRIGGRLAPELARLRDSFNRMAERLAAADAENRRLNEGLLTLQERERAEIAHDLHDQVGPFLFAINIDAAAALRLVKGGRAADAAEQLLLIGEAVGSAQRELGGVVRRLRPVGLAEFGLRDAVDNMIEFWHRRHPAIDFHVAIAPGCDGFSEVIDTTLYRVIQECLSNALRHGAPTIVSLCLDCTADDGAASGEIVLTVTDDGPGLSDATAAGFGLRGMAERVRAIGGRLTLGSPAGGGLVVTAVLPRRSDYAVAVATAEDQWR